MPIGRRASELKPRKSPRQERSRGTVDAILTAAAQVFSTHGYAAGTTNRIAARAGVSIGSLYEYFPNKDALLVALLEAHIDEGEGLVRDAAARLAAPANDLAATVRALVSLMVELHERDPRLHRVLFEEAPLPPRVRRRLADGEARIAADLAEFLDRHQEFKRGDAALAAQIVVQTVEALTHRLVLHEKRTDTATRVGEISALVVAYLTSAAG
jgi:AcrR family transcriptional regulator